MLGPVTSAQIFCCQTSPFAESFILGFPYYVTVFAGGGGIWGS